MCGTSAPSALAFPCHLSHLKAVQCPSFLQVTTALCSLTGMSLEELSETSWCFVKALCFSSDKPLLVFLFCSPLKKWPASHALFPLWFWVPEQSWASISGRNSPLLGSCRLLQHCSLLITGSLKTEVLSFRLLKCRISKSTPVSCLK